MASKNIEFAPERTIRCTNIPLKLLDKTAAFNYFVLFGKCTKIRIREKHRVCLIEYITAETAEFAITQVGEYEGEIFRVGWYKRAAEKKQKAPEMQSGWPVAKKQSKPEADPDWALDPDVKKELEAMGSDFGVKRKYNLRPEAMMVDAEPLSALIKKEKKLKRTWKKEEPAKPAKKSFVVGIGSGEEQELLATLKQAAVTAEEKYRMLEARDKLIRLRRNKRQIDITQTQHTVGTCPDMCPEKERLMREAQHQVALYEQESTGKTICHAIAVKQYSRSSADQETPLPHELRNVDVLQMTMGYLMHRIMDGCNDQEINLGEWFHFLWDRTRGIRKDITQQELCCQGSVALVEQCARFHIHCSARLVAEDPSVFDQKINTENLTKCLQTLKYMYHDLELKGVKCENEAEFRAYIILLNLNDGNFMWEVQQLRPAIQKSSAIKFALDVYSALDKNNYVKFFKLVNSTTYLNACVLFRYFVQVRGRALTTILKCYTPRTPLPFFPVQELVRILAFEDDASAIDFCEAHGLVVNDSGLHIVLDRQLFCMPDVPYALDRAINVIESKLDRSVGEVVCGSALPDPIFEQHQPQNSFDKNGYLSLEEFETVKVLQERSVSPVYTPTVTTKKVDVVDGTVSKENSRDSNPPANFFQNIFPTTAKNVFGGFSQSLTTTTTSTVQSAFARIEKPKPMGGFAFDLSNKVEEDRLRKLREEEAAKILMLEEKRRFEELEAQKQLEIERQLEAQRRLEEEKRKLLEMELERIQLERALKEREALEKQRRDLLEQQRIALLEKQQDELRRRKEVEVQTVVKSVLDSLLDRVVDEHRKNRLKILRQRIFHRRLIGKWRKRVDVNKRKRKAIDQSPLWVSSRTHEEEARELLTLTQDVTLGLRKRYRLGTSSKILTQNIVPVKKLNLPALTYHKLLGNNLDNLKSSVYWKIDVVIPRDTHMAIHNTLNEYIGWKNNCLIERNTKVTYCLQKQSTLQDFECDGVIYIGDLISFSGNTKTPIVFITKQPTNPPNIQITQFTPDNLTTSFDKALEYLSENKPDTPNLQLNTLKSFLSQHLCAELWQRITSFSKWNYQYKTLLTRPQIAIGLHNDALERLILIISDDSRCGYKNFPAIFNDVITNKFPDYLPCDYKYFPTFWKDPGYLNIVTGLMRSMKLPEYQEKTPFDNQAGLEANIYGYLTGVFEDPKRVFYKIMACILRDYDGTTVNWASVIEIIVMEKISELKTGMNQPYSNRTIFNQHFVVYNVGDVESYTREPWFYLTNPLIIREIDLKVPDDVLVEYSSSDEEDGFDLDATMQEIIEEEVDKSEVGKGNDMVGFMAMMDDLERSMSIQKEVSERFQKNLKMVLENV